MEHYTLNGYQLNHSTLSPSVKLYGIFDTLSDALNFLSSYMTQKCEQNDGGNRYLNGNGYRLWREEVDVSEVALDGEWSGGSVDSEWINSISNQKNLDTYQEFE